MGGDDGEWIGAQARLTDEIDSLASSWPRPLVASGYAEGLSRWWCEARAAAISRGEPPFARHPATPGVRGVLFEARRSRWLQRGLEESAKTLASQQQGLEQSPAAQVATGQRRISRLLIVSADGSARFYRDVEKLCRLHANRLEALVLECDEIVLGESIFGAGKTARAVLLDHKEAVMHLLDVLEIGESSSPPEVATRAEG
jgi:hypothetical protein